MSCLIQNTDVFNINGQYNDVVDRDYGTFQKPRLKGTYISTHQAFAFDVKFNMSCTINNNYRKCRM